MSTLLQAPPFSARDDAQFLAEMNALTQWHLAGCAEYRAIRPTWTPAPSLAGLPYLHTGLFKQLLLKTSGDGLKHLRTLRSSATSGAAASRIVLDEQSSHLQAESSAAILRDLVGADQRPLLVLDAAASLQRRGEVSARVAAALSLRPMASSIHFLLDDPDDPSSAHWDRLECLLASHDRLLVYGFTWFLWLVWAQGKIPEGIRQTLARKKIDFVHSGGWKKLEAQSVSRATFDAALLATAAAGSQVIDFYGLVEQVGVIYPLCREGFRHVPRWAAVLVRDAWTLEPVSNTPGLLQCLNVLAHGAPYHSVLTEDLAKLVDGDCPCGRAGQRFELIGRVPKSEIRGCANV